MQHVFLHKNVFEVSCKQTLNQLTFKPREDAYNDEINIYLM